jgi:cation transport ATPase
MSILSTTEESSVPASGQKDKPTREMPYKQAVILLVIGDVLCFLIFVALGRSSHGEASGFAAVPQIITTALPFIAGWFLVSPFVGAFRHKIMANPKAMAIRTALSWLLAWPVAMLLRGIFVDHGVPPLNFAIVVLLFNMLLLLVWRWPFAFNNSMRQRRA